jgi:hypothetical protein
MAYGLVYKARVFWLPAGLGLGMNNINGPGLTGGPAQSIDFFNSTTSPYPPNSTTFNDSDVVNLTNSMAADLLAQMEVAATLTRIQNFSTGTG